MGDKHIFITTPIFYPSAKPHLGHAFTTVIADCMKRYYTELGYKCWFSVGTDEHGEKIFRAAEAAGKSVEEFAEENVNNFKELWTALGIKYDKFIRTSDYSHKALVRKVFEKFDETNQIYFGEWKSWYCNSCEENYSFRSIEKNAVCRLGHPLTLYNENTYFLRTNSFKAWLLKEYQDKENLIFPEHYKREMINNFINDLDDLSISREKVEWGIKVPGREDHTIYVWFDALLNYLSVLNYGNYGKTSTSTFQLYWDDPDSKIIHIIGKEICRFHGIYWPIILKNLNLRMFDTLLVHGWLLMDNEKMSKSKKNVVDPEEILKKIPRDGLRLYLARINFLNDNQVSEEDIFITYNTYLANTFGNLISRFNGIVTKKFGGTLPEKTSNEEFIEISQLEIEIDNLLNGGYEEFITSNNQFSLIEKVFEMFRTTGKLIERYQAWTLEADSKLLKVLVLFIYKLITFGTWALSPVLIDSAPKIYEFLNIPVKKVSMYWLKHNKSAPKTTLKPLKEIFFPRLQVPTYEEIVEENKTEENG